MENIIEENRIKQTDQLDFSNIKIDKQLDLTNFIWLASIVFYNCDLTEIPKLPLQLEKLYISENKLTRLTIIHPNLATINCNNNSLETIKLDCPKLVEFLCCNNKLTDIPDLSSANVTYLDISNNPIKKISNIPNSIEVLDISYCKLKTLPNMANVHTLHAFHNKLYTIELSDSIIEADISYNKIVELIKYPPNLEELDISNNLLTEIPTDYPQSLTTLDISDNNILNFNASYHNIEYFKYDEAEEIDDYEDRMKFYGQDIELTYESEEKDDQISTNTITEENQALFPQVPVLPLTSNKTELLNTDSEKTISDNENTISIKNSQEFVCQTKDDSNVHTNSPVSVNNVSLTELFGELINATKSEKSYRIYHKKEYTI